MKNIVYYVEILDLAPSTVDDDGARIATEEIIIDGYVEVRLEGDIQFWAFAIEDWRVSKWSLSLIGKTIPLRFVFLNLETELSDERIKAIIPVDPNMPVINYTIIGEIIDKEPFPREPDKFEYLQVDCGFILNSLDADKGEYDIGDYIRSEGRLDVYLVEEEKLIKARRDSVVRGER
ncbi:MAG: hypothetical protein U9N61_03895 [Euryarchaeota archaeon]|nr:hypothetical protein [Euryarchaeota archaeon]